MRDTGTVDSTLPLILVIDDDPDLCDATCELLDAAGYPTLKMTVPEDAVSTFQADPHRFGLVLLDWTLPRLSGGQVVRALKTSRPEMPIVVLSGLDEGELKSTLDELGVHVFLQKPYTYKALLAAVGSLTGSSSPPRQT